MVTIKVFLTSSEELRLERLEFTDMVMQLNRAFRLRGIEIELVKWEWLDGSMNAERKQDEYNKALKECEICVVLFWNCIGEYTIEELEIAYKEHNAGRNPLKLFVYFKEPSNIKSLELKDFKISFSDVFGHFYSKFETVDTFKLNFLLQFESYHKEIMNVLRIKGSHILIANQPYADLDKIPFTAKNTDYIRLKEGINQMHEEIRTLECALESTYNENIAKLISHKKSACREFSKQLEEKEYELLDVAKQIAQFSHQTRSDKLQKAIELFENGDNKGAIALINFKEVHSNMQENARKIDRAREIQIQAKKIEDEYQQSLLTNVEESLFLIKTITTKKDEEWLNNTINIYEELIKCIDGRLDEQLYIRLLLEYAHHLVKYKCFTQAKVVFDKIITNELISTNPILTIIILHEYIKILIILGLFQYIDEYVKKLHVAVDQYPDIDKTMEGYGVFSYLISPFSFYCALITELECCYETAQYEHAHEIIMKMENNIDDAIPLMSIFGEDINVIIKLELSIYRGLISLQLNKHDEFLKHINNCIKLISSSSEHLLDVSLKIHMESINELLITILNCFNTRETPISNLLLRLKKRILISSILLLEGFPETLIMDINFFHFFDNDISLSCQEFESFVNDIADELSFADDNS